jgi:hypothetical protein
MKTRPFSSSAVITVVMFVLFASCKDEVVELRDPCDFYISAAEVPLSGSTYSCENCFFKFSFREKLYTFTKNQLPESLMTFRGEGGKELTVYENDFFEFQFAYLHHSRDLFFSLDQQRPLLTPDSLKKTDFNFFQPAFVLKDRCDNQYQVAENTSIYFPEISNHTLKSISVVNSYLINEEPPRYSTTYLISGVFSSQILTNKGSEYISGSYSLHYWIQDPI